MNNIKYPKFSVILPVYFEDNLNHFKESLESIFKQDLQFDQLIIVCDGPLKQNLDFFIKNLNKNLNILIIRIKENKGLANALNTALLKCRNELVFRMDADDICVPNRFSLQIEYILKNPGIDVLSGYVREFYEDGNQTKYIKEVPLEHYEILNYAKLRNPVNHMALLFKKSVVLRYGGYPNLRRSQDYALWTCLLKNGCKFANLKMVLVDVRSGKALYKRRNFYYFLQELNLIFYQKRIGFISYPEFFITITLRFCIRLAPYFIKKYFYTKFSRKQEKKS